MDKMEISVTVTKPDETVKILTESYQGSLSNMIESLKNIKKSTNEYLTDLVNQENANSDGNKNKDFKKKAHKGFGDAEEELSDVELEEDFIDNEINKELFSGLKHSTSCENINVNQKRTKPQSRYGKKRKN